MAVKRGGYTPKQRNSGKRRRNPIFFFNAEGKNKTELLYFKAFAHDADKVVCFARGNHTDPVNMVNELKKTLKENDFSPETRRQSLLPCGF